MAGFAIPQWLLNVTSAGQFAANPAQPHWSDVFQGIGHSMADHYRGTLAGPTGGTGLHEPQMPAETSAPSPASIAIPGHGMPDAIQLLSKLLPQGAAGGGSFMPQAALPQAQPLPQGAGPPIMPQRMPAPVTVGGFGPAVPGQTQGGLAGPTFADIVKGLGGFGHGGV